MPGTYTDQIRPVNNGTSETARIKYVASGTGNVIIDNFGDTSSGASYTVGGIALGGKNYITVDGVNQRIRLSKSGCYNALGNITGANRVVINSVYFDGSNNTCNNMVFIAGYLYGSNVGATQYNVLSNSYFRGISATFNPRTEDVISVAGNAHHNLFNGNTIEYASHLGLNMGSDSTGALPHNNMIRNNVFNNPLHTNLSFYQGGPNDNIAEGNRLIGGGGAPANPNGQGGAGNGMQMSTARTIFRYNIIQKAGATTGTSASIGGFILSIGGDGSQTSIDNNRIYNNTIVKNSGAAIVVANFNNSVLHLNNTQNKFVNNILYDSNSPLTPPATVPIMYYAEGTVDSTGDQFWRNILGRPGGSSTDNIAVGDKWPGAYQTLAQAVAQPCPTFPCFVEQFTAKPNIYSANPDFVNYTSGDYNLNTMSVAIDAGSALTKVATGDTGSGTTLKVDDPYFFQDGRGIPNVQADWIAIGTVSNIVQISSINYSTKTITLASSINRAVGNSIWLYKKSDGQQVLYGAGPEIGALEKIPAVVTPVANFACNPLNARLPSPNVVTCTDSSSNAPTAWSWTFGDGGTSALQNPSRTYTTSGTYNVTLTASNSAGSNALTRSAYVKVSQTLFTSQAPTSANATDGVPYELGMKFKSTKAGNILAIRYFKAASDTGTHVGKIWSATGTLLASVTFTGETASGWQEQTLTAPVAILVNTVYMVSVNITSHFPITTNAFPAVAILAAG